MSNPLHIIILAAGQGKRMQTSLAKVLHPLAGQAMLSHVIQTAKQLKAAKLHIVIGHQAASIQAAIVDEDIDWVIQAEQKGTGHAALQALPKIPDQARVLILSGDVPLIQTATLKKLLDSDAHLNLLVAQLDNPHGFGRIIRDTKQEITAIVEEKDANPQQQAIKEIYTGICAAEAQNLKRWLSKVRPNNQQGEYYLTDIIAEAVADASKISSHEASHVFEIQGVNSLKQLHDLERDWQMHLSLELLKQGVQLADYRRLDIRGQLKISRDVFIDINVILSGAVSIDSHSHIGANCCIKNSSIGKHCIIHPHSIIEDAVIEDYSEVGPFARIRPGTHLKQHCKIGNFVEVKKSSFDEYSKASHLSYIGDASIGKHVNIGAGTITCNYDGANKHQTIIKDHAFIGSDTQLIAPVVIGEGATIGAGSTIREDAPAHALTLSPNRQKSILGWKRPKKQE